jgi:xanthine dehydrogenase accessory factor
MESNWSVPESEVLAGIRDRLDEGQEAMLATVVDVEGSAYRRPGAKMLVTPDGENHGSVTAGCLEDEVGSFASAVLADGESHIETYDLTGDDDVWGLGVGCNGVINILVEPVDESYRPVVETAAAGTDVGIATVIASDDSIVGTHVVYRPDQGFVGATNDAPDWLINAVADPIADLTAEGQSGTVRVTTNGRTADVFVDGIAALPELVVLGSGPDVAPIVELAKNCDFRVTVLTFRGAVAEERFPRADAVRTTSPASIRDEYDFTDNTSVVVMSHNFIDDRLAVEELLDSPVPYLGLLGPRKRFEEMLDDWADEGRILTDAELDRIYTPIGLDLGGGSPYQIAHSVVAELLAIQNDRDPGHLKEREGPIHARVEYSH